MSEYDQRRRRFIRDSGLLLGAAVGGALQPGLSHSSGEGLNTNDRALSRIAFGSCAKESKPQPIWNAVLAAEPELFIFLGDNVYGDTRDMDVLRSKYAQLAQKSGFKKLRAKTQIVATWDDHDFGEDDGGADYPMKEESRRVFLEFWEEPAFSPRWSRDGIYTSYLFGRGDRSVQVILPDLRFKRTPISRMELNEEQYKHWAEARKQAGKPVPGPYIRSPDHDATMLGERQWRWLAEQFDIPARVRIFASSLQVLADFPGWEAWINYAHDHARLLDMLRRKNVSNLFFISGDTHYAELTKLDVNVPFPLWDLTSSGLTEVWPVDVPNANRVGQILREPNFGLIVIDWQSPEPAVQLQALDATGAVRISQRVALTKSTA